MTNETLRDEIDQIICATRRYPAADVAELIMKAIAAKEQPKVPVVSIKLERAEGPSDQCGIPVTVATFAEANAVLRTWALDCPADMLGYLKNDFWVTYADGEVYEGRYDLTHEDQTSASVERHITQFLKFHAGDYCPPHLTRAQYDMFLDQQEEGFADKCRAFLADYQIG